MPFAVFRRHQRKLLAIFAILAMFGFVLADSLPRMLNAGYGGGNQNPEVVKLYGKSIRRSDISEMATQRNNANLFIAQLVGRPIFGDLSTRSLVDAMILEHEANTLRMPIGPKVGGEWLKQATGGFMNREIFEATLSRFGNKVTGEQILTDISNQVRILKVRQLLSGAVVTPLDVFQTYRDQNERISVKAAPFPVESFIAKVADPSGKEIREFYETYKNRLPDPSHDTPGFKVPRQIKAEVLSIDGTTLARKIEERLTEAELLNYYENRKLEFKKPSSFPDEVFQGRPDLTPPIVLSFAEVRPRLAVSLAEEKAQAEIVAKFESIKDEVMVPFADKYLDAKDEIEEAKKSDEKTEVKLPAFVDLAGVAKAKGLDHEITPLLDRDQAERYGEICHAEVGLTKLSGGRKFAAEFFDPKSNLYEPVELTDFLGRRYLTRKIEDHDPRVPPLEEIRSQVVLAWKAEHARPLAEKAASEFAEQVRKTDGKIKEEVVQGRPVITTPPITRLSPGFPRPDRMFQNGPPTLTEIPQIPNPGQELRDAYFALEPGSVVVAPNQPKTIYYVLALNERIHASFAALYSPNGDYFRYQSEAREDATRHREEEQMRQLRDKAGLKPGWIPSDEANREPTT